MFFKKYKNQTIKIAECSLRNFGTNNIANYFKYLRKEFKIFDLDYDVENKHGETRCIIKTGRYNQKAINYFNDRCPAMIESEIRMCRDMYEFVRPNNNSVEKPHPVIIRLPAKKFNDRCAYVYQCPYVFYKFRLSIPESVSSSLKEYSMSLNEYCIKEFFIQSFSSDFNTHILNEEISIFDIKEVLYQRCVEFYLFVDSESKLNELLQKININDIESQLDNELNIKLRKYLHFPI